MDPGSAGVGVMPADSRKVGRLGCQNWSPEFSRLRDLRGLDRVGDVFL